MGELLTSPQPKEPVPIRWIERIFSRLSSYYGSKFADLWSGIDINQVKSDWAEALTTYTAEEIGRGLAECLRHDWPPTLPEFMKRCRPALDPEAAYCEATRLMPMRHSSNEQIRAAAKFSHPAIFWAAAEIGNDLSAGYDRVKVRWRMALEQAYARCYEVGGKFATVPDPAPLLTHEAKPLSKEQHEANLARLRNIVGDARSAEAQKPFTEEDRQRELKRLEEAVAAKEEPTP